MTTQKTVSDAMLQRARDIARTKGPRVLAGACLNLAAKKLTGGLSLQDLPDLPLAMDFRDHWESEFQALGVDGALLAEALQQAEECLRDMLAEEGFPIDGEENE